MAALVGPGTRGLVGRVVALTIATLLAEVTRLPRLREVQRRLFPGDGCILATTKHHHRHDRLTETPVAPVREIHTPPLVYSIGEMWNARSG